MGSSNYKYTNEANISPFTELYNLLNN